MIRAIGCAVIATLALAQQGGAQSRVDQQRQQEEIARQQSLLLANPPAAHPDVFITSLLPKQSTDGIPTGEVVTITCTVINNGESPLNISGIMGSLNDPDNFKGAYLENFTGMPVGEVVEPGGELSLEYRVLPRVPGPMPAQLSALVFYEDADMYYASPCFNQTVVFVKGKTNPSVALQQYLPYALALAVSALAAYFFVLPVLFPAVLKKAASAASGADDEPTLRLLPASKKGGKKSN